MNTHNPNQDNKDRKLYASPAVVHEIELETRAGSPLGFPEELDALNSD